eukprot:TRINITY_DN8782_c0_g2_i4.p1 TRINITY_DN8782_c0_g2~~TRINITY_DN8782_c0_g2_i4.p1  ORF type:complete len:147 (+),score=18.18 TRINITY_DN8782_c0_g2_i4:174-614(+)
MEQQQTKCKRKMHFLISKPLQYLFLSSLIILLHFSTVTAFPLYSSCGVTGNYTNNSTFATNLDLLLSSLASNGATTGFANDTVGKDPDQVYGLVLCRGDVAVEGCRACLRTDQAMNALVLASAKGPRSVGCEEAPQTKGWPEAMSW